MMKTITISCSLMISREQTHDLLCAELSLPEYYGRNLDALHDCLTAISEPTCLRFENVSDARERLGGFARGLFRVLEDSAEENPCLCVELTD